jgi:hypothetical protein
MQQAQRSEVVCKHCKEACWLLDNPCEDTGTACSVEKYAPITDSVANRPIVRPHNSKRDREKEEQICGRILSAFVQKGPIRA